jgi:hypothetical protein
MTRAAWFVVICAIFACAIVGDVLDRLIVRVNS